MGWRALRLSLDRSPLMGRSAALIEASGGRVLRVMFPMVPNRGNMKRPRACSRNRSIGRGIATAAPEPDRVRRHARSSEPR